MKEGEKVDHLEQLYSEAKEGRKQWPPPRGCKRGPRETPAKKVSSPKAENSGGVTEFINQYRLPNLEILSC